MNDIEERKSARVADGTLEIEYGGIKAGMIADGSIAVNRFSSSGLARTVPLGTLLMAVVKRLWCLMLGGGDRKG